MIYCGRAPSTALNPSPSVRCGRVPVVKVVRMKAIRRLVLMSLILICAGCAHTRKLAGLYVPSRCIQKVSWTRPCDTISEHLVKCDGVMVTTSCIAAGHTGNGGQLERDKLPAN